MYFEASSVIRDILAKKGSLKNSVYSSKVKNKKALYALSVETLKYLRSLQTLAEGSGLVNDKSLKHDTILAAVLMYEHLLGHGVKGKYKMILHKYKSSIHSQCERLKIECGVTSIKEALQKSAPSSESEIALPKYVRINTLLAERDIVIEELQADFLWQGVYRGNQEESLLEQLDRTTFFMDEHIPNLLVFCPSVDLHLHKLYQAGKLIIQDKASCFPAFVLDPPPGSTVIDCCAAPGNKTTHCAALMENQGTLYAFDKDPKRLGTLQKLVKKAGASCVTAECCDFLSVDPIDVKYAAVEYILVDPSCSGSGMVNRQRQFTDENDVNNSDRLDQLSKFQISIIKHALSFPNVRRVVYSTCSIHEQENERVVEEVYAQYSDRFDIKHLMPEWTERGLDRYPHGPHCLRMSPESSLTNGFFVACFERKDYVMVHSHSVDTQKDVRVQHTDRRKRSRKPRNELARPVRSKETERHRIEICLRRRVKIDVKDGDILQEEKTETKTTKSNHKNEKVLENLLNGVRATGKWKVAKYS